MNIPINPYRIINPPDLGLYTLCTEPTRKGYHHLVKACSLVESVSLKERVGHLMVATALLIPLINVIIYVALRILCQEPLQPLIFKLCSQAQPLSGNGPINYRSQHILFKDMFTVSELNSLHRFLDRLSNASWNWGRRPQIIAQLLLDSLAKAKADTNYRRSFFALFEREDTIDPVQLLSFYYDARIDMQREIFEGWENISIAHWSNLISFLDRIQQNASLSGDSSARANWILNFLNRLKTDENYRNGFFSLTVENGGTAYTLISLHHQAGQAMAVGTFEGWEAITTSQWEKLKNFLDRIQQDRSLDRGSDERARCILNCLTRAKTDNTYRNGFFSLMETDAAYTLISLYHQAGQVMAVGTFEGWEAITTSQWEKLKNFLDRIQQDRSLDRGSDERARCILNCLTRAKTDNTYRNGFFSLMETDAAYTLISLYHQADTSITLNTFTGLQGVSSDQWEKLKGFMQAIEDSVFFSRNTNKKKVAQFLLRNLAKVQSNALNKDLFFSSLEKKSTQIFVILSCDADKSVEDMLTTYVDKIMQHPLDNDAQPHLKRIYCQDTLDDLDLEYKDLAELLLTCLEKAKDDEQYGTSLSLLLKGEVFTELFMLRKTAELASTWEIFKGFQDRSLEDIQVLREFLKEFREKMRPGRIGSVMQQLWKKNAAIALSNAIENVGDSQKATETVQFFQSIHDKTAFMLFYLFFTAKKTLNHETLVSMNAKICANASNQANGTNPYFTFFTQLIALLDTKKDQQRFALNRFDRKLISEEVISLLSRNSLEVLINNKKTIPILFLEKLYKRSSGREHFYGSFYRREALNDYFATYNENTLTALQWGALYSFIPSLLKISWETTEKGEAAMFLLRVLKEEQNDQDFINKLFSLMEKGGVLPVLSVYFNARDYVTSYRNRDKIKKNLFTRGALCFSKEQWDIFSLHYPMDEEDSYEYPELLSKIQTFSDGSGNIQSVHFTDLILSLPSKYIKNIKSIYAERGSYINHNNFKNLYRRYVSNFSKEDWGCVKALKETLQNERITCLIEGFNTTTTKRKTYKFFTECLQHSLDHSNYRKSLSILLNQGAVMSILSVKQDAVPNSDDKQMFAGFENINTTEDHWASFTSFVENLKSRPGNRGYASPFWYKEASRAQSAQLLINCLDLLKIDDGFFRDKFFLAAGEAATNCQDRRSYYMNFIYFYYCACKNAFPSGMNRVTFIIGLKRIELLNNEARNYRSNIDDAGSESVERGLYLQRELKTQFNLPLFTTVMAHRGLGSITGQSFTDIKNRVLSATNTREKRIDILVENKFWQDYIREMNQAEFNQLLTNTQENLTQNGDESADEFLIRSQIIIAEAINGLLRQKTPAAMDLIESA